MRHAVLVGRNNGRAVSPVPPCGTVVPRQRRFRRHPPRPACAPWRLVALLIGVSLALIATIWEARTSEVQSRFFGRWSSALSSTIEPRPNPQVAFLDLGHLGAADLPRGGTTEEVRRGVELADRLHKFGILTATIRPIRVAHANEVSRTSSARRRSKKCL
jgi:hypothetical protein